ncbi:TIGR01906 family membrane protein [Streptococcus phocae subsp. phocae]
MKEAFYFFLTWLWLFSVAILLTIYLAWALYPLEVSYLQLDEVVFMTPKAITQDFNRLLAYLTNPFVQNLNLAHFSSSTSGLKHFEDVKGLFQLTQLVFIILVYPAWRYLYDKLKQQVLILIRYPLMIAGFFPVLVALFAIMIGFDNFFTLFHQILFVGDSTWLFNPLTDPVIWILPETFFMHCFVLFFIIYESIIWGLVLLSQQKP